jgi:hypothetical protein
LLIDLNTPPEEIDGNEKDKYVNGATNYANAMIGLYNVNKRKKIDATFLVELALMIDNMIISETKKFESENNGIEINKGMPYANLGICYMLQHHYDLGFHWMMKAIQEDAKASENITTLENPIYSQFEDVALKRFCDWGAGSTFLNVLPECFKSKILQWTPEMRISFVSAVMLIVRSFNYEKGSYAEGILFNTGGLRFLGIMEKSLERWYRVNAPKYSPNANLGTKIREIFKHKKPGQYNRTLTSVNTVGQVNDAYNNITILSDRISVILHLALLFRNFTTHNPDSFNTELINHKEYVRVVFYDLLCYLIDEGII